MRRGLRSDGAPASLKRLRRIVRGLARRSPSCQSRRIGKYVSEVLTLWWPTEDGGTALVVPEMKAIVGGRVF